MGTTAIIEGCKEAGLAPGEGVRAALDGPDQENLFADLDEDAARVDQQLGGKAQVGWKQTGRQPGAKNRATRDVVEYVRRTGTDPLVWMSKVTSMHVQHIQQHFGFKHLEDAAEFQRKVAVDLKNTLYPGKTIADLLADAMGDDGGQVVMGFLALAGMKPGQAGSAPPDLSGDGARGERQELGTWSPDDENQQNQELSEVGTNDLA